MVILCHMDWLATGTHDRRPTILLTDSLDTTGNSIHGSIVTTLRNFIGEACCLMAGTKAKSDSALHTIQWTSFKKQTNGLDCGIFTILFLEMFCADPEIFLQQAYDNTYIDLKRASLRAKFHSKLDSISQRQATEGRAMAEESTNPALYNGGSSLKKTESSRSKNLTFSYPWK